MESSEDSFKRTFWDENKQTDQDLYDFFPQNYDHLNIIIQKKELSYISNHSEIIQVARDF